MALHHISVAQQNLSQGPSEEELPGTAYTATGNVDACPRERKDPLKEPEEWGSSGTFCIGLQQQTCPS